MYKIPVVIIKDKIAAKLFDPSIADAEDDSAEEES